jgi:hypothetical protein
MTELRYLKPPPGTVCGHAHCNNTPAVITVRMLNKTLHLCAEHEAEARAMAADVQALRKLKAILSGQPTGEPEQVPSEDESLDSVIFRELYGFLGKYIHIGLVESPVAFCSGRPGQLCLASPWEGKEPHCNFEPDGCLFPDIGQA